MSDEITKTEATWLDVMRLNAAERKREINKTWEIGRLAIRVRWRSKECLWGRFGGGWNWALGFRVGTSTLLLHCLVFSVSVVIKKQKEKSDE